jgi:glycosyltransferase involved in cell wall biosynthesis
LDSKRIQGWEKEHTRRADVCIAVSKDDAEYLGEEYGIANVLVVPNGVDCAAFAPPEDNVRNPYELLFMGGLHYAPNLDAVNWLAAEIFPEIRKQIPQMTCTLVGPGAEKHQERLERAGLQVLGLVPDVRPYLHRATAMVVPLRAGGGTRVKILEAMAAGLPVISTHLGAEGLGLRHEEHVLYADQPEEFATAAKRLVSDPPLWSRLAENGMRLVQEKYDWSALGLRLLSHYELLLRERPSS